MTLASFNIYKQYQTQLFSVVRLLMEGIDGFSIFLKDLEAGFVGIQDGVEYIKNKLNPSIENLKSKFGLMIEEANKLLQQINNNLESCVLDIKKVNDNIKEIDCSLLDLQKHLEGKERDIREAERQCEGRKQDLFEAESALCNARQRLEDAESNQRTAVVGGSALWYLSILLTPVFPPAAVGIVGGAAIGVSGLTVLEDVKNECLNRVSTARNAVSTSEENLEKAKNLKTTTESQLSELKAKKFSTEKELHEKNRMLEDIRNAQHDCISMNEYMQKLFRELCDFNGKCNVLCCETIGGYSLDCLKSPTVTACSSLTSLIQCRVIQSSCEPYQLTVMKSRLTQIQTVHWPSVTYDEDSLI